MAHTVLFTNFSNLFDLSFTSSNTLLMKSSRQGHDY